MKRSMLFGALVVLAMAGVAQAFPPPPPVPEIDPGFAAGAIALLAGCVMMLRARLARK
ncbi:MAG: hypothetical protein NTX87_18330 [Planctomycetota bacterium]|nr:hypothetical protein [Planctomycetota bacterium]